MAPRENNWIDGLRGIAALMVAITHLLSAFVPDLHNVAAYENGPSWFGQWPIMRLCVAGPTALALFFLISGYVSSVRAISAARKDPESALRALAKTTLARPLRLILPATVATAISWVLAELGAYRFLGKIDAEWIRNGVFQGDPNIFAAIYRLYDAIKKTWCEGWDEFDGTQWPMVLLLESSIITYVMLLATAYCRPWARRTLFTIVFWYGWYGGQVMKTCNTMAGMLLAEIHSTYGADCLTRLPAPFPFLLMLLGMFFGSYPQNAAQWAPWSAALQRWIIPHIPTETRSTDFPIEQLYEIDHRRYWHMIGATVFIIGAASSRGAQRLLSTNLLNFMGSVSLPVYLLHNQLLKTIYAWIIYLPGSQEQVHPETGLLQPAGAGRFWVATPLFFGLLYWLAWLWTKHVDVACDKVTKRFLATVLETPGSPPSKGLL